jgi:hypothetical protein
MTRKALATIFLIAGSFAICFGQNDTAVQLDAGKPHVYLALERAEGDLVWFRLRNNSRWAINLRIENPGSTLVSLQLANGRMVNALADAAIVSPEYIIEQPDSVGAGQYWCTSSPSWIAPSSSILFSVPRQDFRLASRLSVRFSYEWEVIGGEVEHRIKFSEVRCGCCSRPAATKCDHGSLQSQHAHHCFMNQAIAGEDGRRKNVHRPVCIVRNPTAGLFND